MSYGYWGMHTVGYNGCVLQIQANKGCIWRNLWTRTALVCPLWCIWPRNTHFATLYGISFHWGYIGYCCRKYVWEHIKELYHKPLCICVCERETGLQLNQSCLCACSLNPLSVKTQFVWELKETGELLKLAEASLIENQQTTETPQHTHTHTERPVQCNTHRVPYSQSLHMKNVDCSCWAKLVDFSVCNCRWTAVAFQTSSYRLLLLQLTTTGKNIIPPGS